MLICSIVILPDHFKPLPNSALRQGRYDRSNRLFNVHRINFLIASSGGKNTGKAIFGLFHYLPCLRLARRRKTHRRAQRGSQSRGDLGERRIRWQQQSRADSSRLNALQITFVAKDSEEDSPWQTRYEAAETFNRTWPMEVHIGNNGDCRARDRCRLIHTDCAAGIKRVEPFGQAAASIRPVGYQNNRVSIRHRSVPRGRLSRDPPGLLNYAKVWLPSCF